MEEVAAKWREAKRTPGWRAKVLAASDPAPELVKQIDAHLRLIHETVQRDLRFS